MGDIEVERFHRLETLLDLVRALAGRDCLGGFRAIAQIGKIGKSPAWNPLPGGDQERKLIDSLVPTFEHRHPA